MPPRRRRGSLGRQTGHRRPGPHGRLELTSGGELLEGRRVTLREVELRLHYGRRRWQRPGRLRIRTACLSRVRIHVVIDVLLHLRLSREAPPAIGHGAAERPIALVRARVLIQDRLLPEVLAALRALVRLLTGVDA